MTSPSPRVRGPIAVAVFLSLAAAAATGAWFLLGERPQPTEIVDISAIDDEYAAMIRDVRGDPGRSFLSLFHIDRGEVWGALIPRYVLPGSARTGLTTTLGTIVVRASAKEGIGVTAFAAAQGEKMGRLTLAGPDGIPAGDLPGIGTVSGGGQSFEILGEPGQWASVTAVDVARGEPLWDVALGDAPVGQAWLRERHLLLYQPGRMRILDRATGKEVGQEVGMTAGARIDPWPCVTEDRIYGLRGEALHVFALPGSDAGGSDLAARALPVDLPPGSARMTGSCGRYHAGDHDHDVLAMNLEDGTSLIMAVEREPSKIAWTVPLDAPLVPQEALRMATPDAAPPAGTLPRFVPLLVGRPDDVTIIMIDVEAGRVAWQGVPGAGLAQARLMHHGAHHYLWIPDGALERRPDGALAVFDGETGALAAAVSLSGYAPLWPRNMAGGRIWIHGTRRWAVLDAATLAVVPSQGVSTPLPDVREAVARDIGIPVTP